MGVWKLIAALLVGASLTEGGRKTLRNLIKETIKAGQCTMEKATEGWDEVKSQTTKLVEEVKSEKSTSKEK